MAPPPLGSTEQQNELLDVKGFDLLPQVEAMLRHVRESSVNCSGCAEYWESGRPDVRPAALDAVREHVRRLRETTETVADVIDEIEQTTERSDAPTSGQTAGRRRR